LTVNFTVSGTGRVTAWITSRLGTNVVFAPGVTNITNFVVVIDDAELEGNEFVVVTLQQGTGYAITSPNTATGNDSDDEVLVHSRRHGRHAPLSLRTPATSHLHTDWADGNTR
jgi:hypothetical protein